MLEDTLDKLGNKLRKYYFKYVTVRISQNCPFIKSSPSSWRFIFGAKVRRCVRAYIRKREHVCMWVYSVFASDNILHPLSTN